MDLPERIKKAVSYLKGAGIIETQKDIALKMNFNKSTISSALKGNDNYLTESFLIKFNDAFPEINKQWLMTGKGDMLKKEDPPPETQSYQISMPKEVFEQITQMTETILSQQKTIYNQQEIIAAKDKVIENLLNQLNQKKPIKIKKEVKRDFI